MNGSDWHRAARKYVIGLEEGSRVTIDDLYRAVGPLDPRVRGSLAGVAMTNLERSAFLRIVTVRASRRPECRGRRVFVYERTGIGKP